MDWKEGGPIPARSPFSCVDSIGNLLADSCQSITQLVLPLMSVTRKHPLFSRQIREKPEASNTIGADSLAVDPRIAAQQVAQVVPVELPPLLEFLHQPRRIEGIARLPELQYQESADQLLIERPRGEHPEIVDVACLVALIAGADFLGKNFGQRKAGDFGGRERQEPEVTLPDLRAPFCRQRRRFSPADLQLDFAHSACIPLMRIGRIDAP